MKNNFVKKLLKRNASSGRASAQISTQETEAKYAQKADQYEDFEVLAERLRKEGKLNEENFKRIKRRMIYGYILIATTLGAAIILQINHHSLGFVLFLLGLAFSWQYVVNRAEVSRKCYLYSFGIRVYGKIIDAIIDGKTNSFGNFLLTLNKNNCYEQYITFQFTDKNGKTLKIQQLNQAKLIPKNAYKVGDSALAIYSPTNSLDIFIESSEEGFGKINFNLIKQN